ncbi:DHS-like NAD/FAD-binding domain-containing protein [Chytriomyces sp. MP71]|nr:DHS-like NAD/FAD-binding domain-containing protein [Chytriomyces sp. MP71]
MDERNMLADNTLTIVLAEDEGFAVYPKSDCGHVQEYVEASLVNAFASIVVKHSACRECRDESENWICLKCAYVGCSRYVASHMLNHNTASDHAVALSLADLSAFCYMCNDYIIDERLAPFLDLVHRQKFGESHSLAVSLCKRQQEAEAQASSSAPFIRNSKTIEAFAEVLLTRKCRKIVVLTGAGVSTSAGIPDFRTPGTGLYDNLEKYNLPTPQSIFDINFYRHNPEPFNLLAKEMFPGNFSPTPSHYFIKLLSKKGMLLRNWTQNIDSLETMAGIPQDELVEAHGSFRNAKCVGQQVQGPVEKDINGGRIILPMGCGQTYSQGWIKERLFKNETPTCPNCTGLVKPDITFFGEKMPARFKHEVNDFDETDALICMGTSLQVMPFSVMHATVSSRVPRLLINHKMVGNFGKESTDAIFLGDCDAGCMQLARLLGFEDELNSLITKGRAEFELNRSDFAPNNGINSGKGKGKLVLKA